MTVIIKRPRKARSDSVSECEIKRLGAPCGNDAEFIHTAIQTKTGVKKLVRTCDDVYHLRNARKQMTEFARRS